jgi:subtilisin family serine protease
MRQSIAVCALLLCAAAAGFSQGLRETRGRGQASGGLEVVDFEGRAVVAGELLVKFREGNSEKLRGDSVRMRRLGISESRDLGRSGYSQLRVSSGLRSVMDELSRDADVEYVEPNYVVEVSATAPNDPLFSRQWGLKNTGQDGGLVKADIDATAAWDITKGVKKNVIAVVDTGVDYTHPDLAANMWSAPRSFTVTFAANDSITCPAGSRGYNAIANTCDPKDNATHGTMVAGTIGAAGNSGAGTAGVAWTTSIMGLAFMDSTGRGSVANAIRAIEFAIQAKKALGDGANVRVLNNSWGGSGFSQALLDTIQKASAAGMLFVAAAGNSKLNLDTQQEYPAAYTAPNVLTIAATDNKDALASFSSWGVKFAHAGAPGVSIATTSPGASYVLASGTSFAAPVTSGVAALVLAACDTLDPVAVRKAILDNVDPVPGMAGKVSTGGRVNAYKAVRNCAALAAPVVKPGFTVAANPLTVTLNPGSTVTVGVQIAAVGGFTGQVLLSLAGLPAGVTGSFNASSASPGAAVSLRLTAAANASLTAGAVAASIRGVSGALSSTSTMAVTVKPVPSFHVSADPASATIVPGASAAYTFTLTPIGDFNQSIFVQLTGLPAGTSGQFSQPSPGKLVLTVRSSTAVVPRTYTLTATAISGTLRKPVPLTLQVNAR